MNKKEVVENNEKKTNVPKKGKFIQSSWTMEAETTNSY